jgi:hypothetical protein
MPQTGPELPPNLREKRKRSDDEDDDSPPSRPTSAASAENADKRPRTIGPTLPPHLQGGNADASSDSDSDDDFGPGLPSAAAPVCCLLLNQNYSLHMQTQDTDSSPQNHPENPTPDTAKPAQRDEWMLVPPSQSDWSSRVDPTKLRNRKFNTGKGAKAPTQGPGGSDVWSETPEQKRKRLENEVMGIQNPTTNRDALSKSTISKAEREAAEKRIREHAEKSRGKTLYAEHQKVNKEKDDDPSARTFDREKDIAGGMKINHAKRKEMLNRAADFGSKFSGGNYL